MEKTWEMRKHGLAVRVTFAMGKHGLAVRATFATRISALPFEPFYEVSQKKYQT